jgi:hypothetical protein
VAVVVAAILASSDARAQPSAGDRALAQTLFDQGRAAMEIGNYADGCPKLAESHKLDPSGGTVLNLAICYSKAGKHASAWAAFNEAADLAHRDRRAQREKFARKNVEELKPKLSYLEVSVLPAVRTPGLEVLLDGRPMPETAWGIAVPVDPGEHVVSANAPGRKRWRRAVSFEGIAKRETVQVEPLEHEEPVPVASTPAASASVAPPAASVEAPVPVPPPPPVAPPQQRQQEQRGSDRATWGYAAGGLGIAALGVGAVFGMKALSSWSNRNDHCTAAGCDPVGLEAGADAKSNATIANVGIGLGVVGIGLGTYLLLTPPGPAASGDSAMLQLGGAW